MIELKNLSKTFLLSDTKVEALRNISLSVNDGDIYGIIGMSGAGKSTLVRCINMLERPSGGSVLIDGLDIGLLEEKELRSVRRRIAMIFQSFNLLMQRTCLKNVCFPLELEGMKRTEAEKRARELLELVGLPDKAEAYPAQLSGGQKQRVAIARALATEPEVLLCDEATSALDPKTTHSILGLIRDINKRLGITVIIITHQMSVVEEICNRVAILDNGSVAEEGDVTDVFSHPKSEAARRLVFPENAGETLPVDLNCRKIRIVFNGQQPTSEPVIASMAMSEGIAASILYASSRMIGNRVYGSMVLGLPDDGTAVKRALAFLSGYENIIAEEVTENE